MIKKLAYFGEEKKLLPYKNDKIIYYTMFVYSPKLWLHIAPTNQ
jgi:hypothetical protein